MRAGWDMTRRDWQDHELFRNNLACLDAQAVGRGTEAWLSELGYVRERSGYRCLREDDSEMTIAVFGHEGSTVSALAQILQLPFPYLCCTLHLPYTGITVVRLPREPGSVGMPYLELVSDGRHIRDIPPDPESAPYPPTDWS